MKVIDSRTNRVRTFTKAFKQIRDEQFKSDYKFTVTDSEGGIYFRCNDRQKAVEYVQDWHGIGLPLHIVGR